VPELLETKASIIIPSVVHEDGKKVKVDHTHFLPSEITSVVEREIMGT